MRKLQNYGDAFSKSSSICTVGGVSGDIKGGELSVELKSTEELLSKAWKASSDDESVTAAGSLFNFWIV